MRYAHRVGGAKEYATHIVIHSCDKYYREYASHIVIHACDKYYREYASHTHVTSTTSLQGICFAHRDTLV